MFVLSVEGPAVLDRCLWCTHKIVGVFESREKALEVFKGQVIDEFSIWILTDVGGSVERLG